MPFHCHSTQERTFINLQDLKSFQETLFKKSSPGLLTDCEMETTLSGSQ